MNEKYCYLSSDFTDKINKKALIMHRYRWSANIIYCTSTRSFASLFRKVKCYLSMRALINSESNPNSSKQHHNWLIELEESNN